jgi:hypothetical protein
LRNKIFIGGLLVIVISFAALAQQDGAHTTGRPPSIDPAIVDFIARFQSILGALVGSLLTIAIGRRLGAERRRLEFLISRTEDLSKTLKVHHQELVVSVKDQTFSRLNRSVIKVRNTGNVSLKSVDFYVEIPGQRSAYLADVIAGPPDLTSGIKIITASAGPTVNPVFHVVLESFLNPGESFNVVAFFDGNTSDCKVRCRIADVKVTIKSTDTDDDVWP